MDVARVLLLAEDSTRALHDGGAGVIDLPIGSDTEPRMCLLGNL